MSSRRNSKRLLFTSLAALILTLGGVTAGAYGFLSTRVVRFGDSFVVGPNFHGEFSFDGGATRLRLWRENGSPVIDAPSWKGRGPITMTFMWGFSIYHTPPGTLVAGKPSPR